jgi:hypothetical protein
MRGILAGRRNALSGVPHSSSDIFLCVQGEKSFFFTHKFKQLAAERSPVPFELQVTEIYGVAR